METVVRFVVVGTGTCPSVQRLYLSKITVTDYVTSILIKLFNRVLFVPNFQVTRMLRIPWCPLVGHSGRGRSPPTQIQSIWVQSWRCPNDIESQTETLQSFLNNIIILKYFYCNDWKTPISNSITYDQIRHPWSVGSVLRTYPTEYRRYSVGGKAPDRSAPLGVTKGCVAFQFPNKHPFFELLDKLKNRKKHMNELSHHFLE